MNLSWTCAFSAFRDCACATDANVKSIASDSQAACDLLLIGASTDRVTMDNMVELKAVPVRNRCGWWLLSVPLNASAGGGHPESVDARAAVWHEHGGES